MTVKERAQARRQPGNRYADPSVRMDVQRYRCKHCAIVVDERWMQGHLAICTEVGPKGVTFSRGCSVEEHFDVIK